MKTKMIILAGAVIAPALLAAAPVQAQVSGIAVADPASAILSANALGAANTQIATTYKAQIDQISARQQALQTQITNMVKPLDTNKDGQVSEAELTAAQNAKNPIIQQVVTARQTGEQEIARLADPVQRARIYAIEQIAQKYGAATNTVVASKKISLLLSANTVQFAQPTVDVTDAIKAELDRTLPSVSTTPPANWQPSQQSVQLFQQYEQAIAVQAAQRQQQGAPGAAPATATPPANTKKPSGR